MQYTTLGQTDVCVSRVCLGTAFRSARDEATHIAAIHAAIDMGCNYLDTANVYQDGRSERIVGKAVKGKRDKLIIETKVGTPMTGDQTVADLSRGTIMQSIDDSLARLDLEFIDSLICHFPDEVVPHVETFEALDELVKAGKVRTVGVSRWESWRLAQVLSVCEQGGFARPVSNQCAYSLLDRRLENEVLPYCGRMGVSVTAFATTLIGLLTGRYRFGEPPPPGTSWHRGPYNFRHAMRPTTGQVIDSLVRVADEAGHTPTQVAIAWCLHHGVTSVIIGADTVEQVHENFVAGDVTLSDGHVAQLDDASDGMCLSVRKGCPGGWVDDDDGASTGMK